MAAAAQLVKDSGKGQVLHCFLDIPGSHLSKIPADAVSFDRWGAVVEVRQADVKGRAVSAQDSVLLDVALPPSRTFGRRAIHCIGSATHVSASTAGSLWLVLRFSQLNIRQLEPAPQSVHASVLPPENVRDHLVSEELAGTTGSGD